MRTQTAFWIGAALVTVACSNAPQGGSADMSTATGGSVAQSGGSSAGGSLTTGGTTGGSPATGGSGSGATGGAASGGQATGGTSAETGGTGGGDDPDPTGCTRELLGEKALDLAAALEAGDATLLTTNASATYIENHEPSEFGQGVWANAVEIEFQRDFLDEDTCETFSEIIITAGTPLVLGVRLTLTGQDVSEVSALVSNDDDWLFDADNYAAVSSAEDWSEIPEADRDTREVLIAAGDAYFDLFSDKSVVVPWNTPCTRLEGGQVTTGDTCDVGVPDGIEFSDKHWIVDRVLGTATGMVLFAGSLPDSHMFRSLKGKIRYVHTITICDGGC